MNRSDLFAKIEKLSIAHGDGQLSYQDYRAQRSMLIDAVQFDLSITDDDLIPQASATGNVSHLTDNTAQSKKIDSPEEDSANAEASLRRKRMSLYVSILALVVAALIVFYD